MSEWKIESNADKILKLVLDKKRVTLTEAEAKLGLGKAEVEELSKIMDSQGLLRLVYPSNPFTEPYLEAV